MKISVSHNLTIPTNKPDSIYSTNPSKDYLQFLKEEFINRIFKGIYVTDVTNLEIGKIVTEDKRTGGFVRITLGCILNGVRYDKYETIYGKVVKILDDMILLQSDYCSIGVLTDKRLQFVKEGDIIPVMNMSSDYEPFKKKIITSAIPKIPISTNINCIIKIPNNLDSYKKIISDYEKNNKPSKKTIDALYKCVKKAPKHTTTDIRKLKTNTTYKISRPDYIEYASPFVIAEEVKEDIDNSKIIIDIYNTIIKEMEDAIEFDQISDDRIISIYHSSRLQ